MICRACVANQFAAQAQSQACLSCPCALCPHLFHHLAHGGQMTGRARFNPLFITLRGFLQVRQEPRVVEALAALLDDSSNALPNPEEFSTGLEEKIFVE